MNDTQAKTHLLFNVTNQHILQNFKGFTNEIVTTQPQEFPQEHRKNYGQRRTQKPRYVRLPTLSTKYARAGGQTSTLPSRYPQGKSTRQEVEHSNSQISLPER